MSEDDDDICERGEHDSLNMYDEHEYNKYEYDDHQNHDVR